MGLLLQRTGRERKRDTTGMSNLEPREVGPAASGRFVRSRKRAALCVFGIALAVQACYLLEASRDPSYLVPIVDAGTYHAAARDFALGQTGHATAGHAYWQPPGFPLLLGCVYRVVGVHILAAKCVLAVFASLNCVMVWWLGTRAFSRRVGTIAGLMLALYGPFLFYSTQLLPVGMAMTLNLLALVLWMRGGQRGGWANRLALGLVIGAAVITVPNSGVIWLAVLWTQVRAVALPGQARRAVAAASLTALGLLIPIGATTVRNYAASGEFVIISTNGGINFFLGNNAHADETVAIRPGEAWERFSRGESGDPTRRRSERSREFMARARTYIAENPVDFARGLGRKAVRLINAREIPRNVDPHSYRDSSRLLAMLMWRVGPVAVPFGLVAPLAMVGIFAWRGRGRARRRLCGRLALYVALYGISVVLFFVTSRHRLPMIPVIIIFAAAGLVEGVNRLRNAGTRLWGVVGGYTARLTPARRGSPAHIARSTPGSIAAPVSFIVAAALVNLPISSPTDHVDFKAEFHLCVAEHYLNQGERERAEQHFRQALRLDPDYAAAQRKLALFLMRVGDFDEASSLLARAVELNPASAEALWARGEWLRRRDRLDEALRTLEAALALDPHSARIHAALAETLIATGRTDEGVDHYFQAINLFEDPGPALIRLADLLTTAGRYEEAIECYRKGLWRVEPDLATLNRVALLLATCPRAELRDCRQAIGLAEHACAVTSYRVPGAMDTLAMAYAECGRWEDAAGVAHRALDLALAGGDTSTADAIRPRLEQYEAHRNGPPEQRE